MIAVEPLAEMRAVLARIAPEAEAVAGTAEALPLADASADAVTVGQAFHWFDAEPAAAEIARVLRPGGALALVWNIRDLSDTLQQRINELLRAGAPRHAVGARAAVARGARGVAGVRRRARSASFPWAQAHTTEELRRPDRVGQLRRAPRAGRARGAAGAGAREVVATLPQPFEFRYRTDVYVFPRALGHVGQIGTDVRVRPVSSVVEGGGTAPHPNEGGGCAQRRAVSAMSVLGVRSQGIAAGVPADQAVRGDQLGDALEERRSSQPSATSSATRSPWNTTGTCVARLGTRLAGLGPEDELAVLDEEDPGPRAAAVGDERVDDRAQDVVRVAAAVEDPLDRLERRAHGGSSVELRHAGRGTTRAPAPVGASARSISTSVCFAVAISTSATPSSSQR